jgi:hypothetical protein
MADETVTGRGGSFILECSDGKGGYQPLEAVRGPKGPEYHHRSKGKIRSVEVFDGSGGHATIDIERPGADTKIVIHYDV